jgi:signal transduction histidine kinase
VLHGVRRNPGGRGTVSLCTAEAADCWRVTVSDDGPGLDRQAKPDRERIQIGLKNVEERLRLICGGSLELASEPGKGTTVTFRIPK